MNRVEKGDVRAYEGSSHGFNSQDDLVLGPPATAHLLKLLYHLRLGAVEAAARHGRGEDALVRNERVPRTPGRTDIEASIVTAAAW